MLNKVKISPLTDREKIVARHLFVCASSLEIAHQTHVHKRVVEHDLLQLRRKMGERSSFLAAVKAFHFGLLEVIHESE